MTSEFVPLRPRTVPGILNDAFRLYWRNAASLLGITVVGYVPAVAVLAFAGFVLSAIMPKRGPTSWQSRVDQWNSGEWIWQTVMAIAVMGLLSLCFRVILSPMTGALTRAVGGCYLGEKCTIGSCYGHIFRMLGKYVGTIMLNGLALILGYLLFVIPCFFFAVWFMFTSNVCVLEGLGGTMAMRRSRCLAHGHAGRIIGLALLTYGGFYVLEFAARLSTKFAVLQLTEDVAVVKLVGQGVHLALGAIAVPFFAIVWTLLYYDIRIRKERVDLGILTRDMHASAVRKRP